MGAGKLEETAVNNVRKMWVPSLFLLWTFLVLVWSINYQITKAAGFGTETVLLILALQPTIVVAIVNWACSLQDLLQLRSRVFAEKAIIEIMRDAENSRAGHDKAGRIALLDEVLDGFERIQRPL